MEIQTSEQEARERFEQFLDLVGGTERTVEIVRPGKPDVVLVDAAELRSLRETLYLLGTRVNAERLWCSADQAGRGSAAEVSPEALEALALAAERGDDETVKGVLTDVAKRVDANTPAVVGAETTSATG